ncbi:CoA-binding protein [Deinococcus cellulosilyticus]|uniref:CoA-binding domain-containing protein n=1 Tax=Deinococcus cellulosilyticus (strain DSM 18568 / NBRC 106333 / KACC 11606 / 5516J-15) TaxID=1223518 RepID=A0A511NAU1_DEIC1|nr:CoA-binding protein [Deinococcus cellulosilyticus]GEM49666.1 hypothetical protein DC3_53010 [Deinococcus cellulosilyticus NBRC 106333 = KACC 11606]
MTRLNNLVQQFLVQKSIAVVGVSEKKETGATFNYKKFKEAGYRVYPINPHLQTFQGSVCYPDLKSLPEKVDAVFVLANPGVTQKIVEECVRLGIKYVWMHCMMGVKPGAMKDQTSVSAEAIKLCQEHGIHVIPGSCPAQFLNPDFGHRMIRGVCGLMGNLKIRTPA